MHKRISTVFVFLVFVASSAGAMSFEFDLGDLGSNNKDEGFGYVLEIPLEGGFPCLVASVELGLSGSEEVEVFALAEMGGGPVAIDQITVSANGTYVFDVTKAARYAQANGQAVLTLEISDLVPEKGIRGFKLESGTATVSYSAVGGGRNPSSTDDDPEASESTTALARSTATVVAVPNPFNPSTHFKLALDKPGNGSFNVYDVSGKRVRCLHSGPISSGAHEFFWDGRDEAGGRVSSGLYLYQYADEHQTVTGKVVMLK
jgi:hypothetical protein